MIDDEYMDSIKSTTKKPSDRTLVERCLRGDEKAWRALVDRYARLVHSVPVRHGLNPVEVDDIGQEVFMALAQNLHRIDDPERLPAWLLTTARRASWRLIHKRKREQPGARMDVSELEPSASARRIGAGMPSMGELFTAWERQELLAQAMTSLRERCRALLSLIFLDPMEPSYDEISAQIGIKKGSIGPTRNRCLAQLRTILVGLDAGADL